MTALRVVLAADEAAGRRALKLLVGSAHEPVLVAVPAAADEPSALRDDATALGVPTIDARRLGSAAVASELSAVKADVLLNVHSLTKVCSEALDVFGVGAWNLHPGPLPEGAGINVPSWAVALGWEEHGVTLHRMTAEYDAGDIAYEDRFPIRDSATGLTLSAECGSRGLRLVSALLDQLAEDPSEVPAAPQSVDDRAYFGKGQPNNGRIDWTAPAERIEAHVRAADFRPFPSPWHPPVADVDGELVGLVEVSIGDVASVPPGTSRRVGTELSIAAADRWVTVNELRSVCT